MRWLVGTRDINWNYFRNAGHRICCLVCHFCFNQPDQSVILTVWTKYTEKKLATKNINDIGIGLNPLKKFWEKVHLLRCGFGVAEQLYSILRTWKEVDDINHSFSTACIFLFVKITNWVGFNFSLIK